MHFASTGIDRTAINTIYTHVLNPMIASRSYMSIEPIELWLDTKALRRGLVYPVDPDTDPWALCVQDSGMVPVSTQIAIVNPETQQLCHTGEFGEIWVQSEACAKSFYLSKQEFDKERFNGRIIGGDPNAQYLRTGDLGFLHNVTRPIGAGNQPVDMQILFVLGSIGETFEVNGLNHFPIDIENSVEKCHRNISAGGCAVFQAGGLVVVLVEVFRKAYLASLVPVVVNAILNEHQLVVDIVAFVGQGDFPRSRLSEKQRGKILASWVTRKLRVIAQFSIRDPDGEPHAIQETAETQRHGPTSLLSKNQYNTSDLPRNSIASETTSHLVPGSNGKFIDSGSSIMPEHPQGVLPRSDSQRVTEQSTQPNQDYQTPPEYDTPSVALNDKPYVLDLPHGISEMPSTTFDDYSTNESNETNDEFANDRFYDPNADPFNPYGEYAPDPFEYEALSQNQTPRLSIANPTEYENERDDANSTPTTTNSSSRHTAIPQSAHSEISSQWTDTGPASIPGDVSPYQEEGNPFASNIPASVPSFDFVSPSGPPRVAPVNPSVPSLGPVDPPPAPAAVARGRAALPSQQARFSTYGTVTVGPPAQPLQQNALRKMSSNQQQMRPHENSVGSDYGQYPAEALAYGDAVDKGRQLSVVNSDDGNENVRGNNVQSVSGSVLVRRRYDGSDW